jgi:zinc protease
MTDEKLDNQRDVVKNERRWSIDNQPYGTWEEKLQTLIYPEAHPYHHSVIGSMEDLGAASLHDVSEFFETYYRPNNAVLTIAGDFDPDRAMEMVERHFGPIPANQNLPPQPDMELEPFLLGKELREVVPDQVPLPRIYLAYRIPTYGSEPFQALEVGADVLGTGRASRLYANLIRKNQLAQDVAVFPFPLVGGASMLAIWATARPGVSPDRLESALSGEIAHLLEAGPKQDELARVRNLHDASVGASLEQVSERADRISMYTTFFDEPERINSEISRYDAVTSQRVQEAYATFVRPDNQVVVTYVPAESAEEAA